MNRYFITGTDTDCGKTYVTSQLVHSVKHSIAIKPVASGCTVTEGELISSDALQLRHNNRLTLEQINPWRFSLPVSPHIAAVHDGKKLAIEEIANYCMNIQIRGVQTLFIEGAGGLLVPLNDQETWVDFLKITDIPVILVVGMKLGCINHALLTEQVLELNKIPCKGWIANCLDPQMLALEENIETLKKKLAFPLLSRINYSEKITNIEL